MPYWLAPRSACFAKIHGGSVLGIGSAVGMRQQRRLFALHRLHRTFDDSVDRSLRSRWQQRLQLREKGQHHTRFDVILIPGFGRRGISVCRQKPTFLRGARTPCLIVQRPELARSIIFEVIYNHVDSCLKGVSLSGPQRAALPRCGRQWRGKTTTLKAIS